MMGLMVIRHRGMIDLDSLGIDILASHAIAGDDPRDAISETLVHLTASELSAVEHLPGVISVAPALPGRFGDDTEGAVLVRRDGSYVTE